MSTIGDMSDQTQRKQRFKERFPEILQAPLTDELANTVDRLKGGFPRSKWARAAIIVADRNKKLADAITKEMRDEDQRHK